MNNTDFWYTESEVLMLFGYATKSSAYPIRDKVKTRKLSNRYLYLRSDIDKLLEERYTTKREIECLNVAKEKIENCNIDLDMWIPLKAALKIVPFSRQRLYQLKNNGTIDYKVYDGFMLFNKEELNALSCK